VDSFSSSWEFAIVQKESAALGCTYLATNWCVIEQ